MSMNPSTSSGLKSADGIILAMPGRLMGLQVNADGTNQATVVLYDNASAASGTVLAKVIVDATLTSEELVVGEAGVVVNNGIYADVTGTGAEFIVYFTPG